MSGSGAVAFCLRSKGSSPGLATLISEIGLLTVNPFPYEKKLYGTYMSKLYVKYRGHIIVKYMSHICILNVNEVEDI